jgi:hypothetical protein
MVVPPVPGIWDALDAGQTESYAAPATGAVVPQPVAATADSADSAASGSRAVLARRLMRIEFPDHDGD